jgi:asparagine synthetase B (glutamine-hydrolysing)
MCGIFTLVNINYSKLSVSTINESFLKGKSRGPENSTTKHFLNSFCGFHRLAITPLKI